MLKSILLFCAKCVAFTIIFWSLAMGVFAQLFAQPERNSRSAQDAQTADQVATYEKQVARVNHQLDVVEAQQIRMEKNLSAQEETTKRFNAILNNWEKQSLPRMAR